MTGISRSRAVLECPDLERELTEFQVYYNGARPVWIALFHASATLGVSMPRPHPVASRRQTRYSRPTASHYLHKASRPPLQNALHRTMNIGDERTAADYRGHGRESGSTSIASLRGCVRAHSTAMFQARWATAGAPPSATPIRVR